MFGNSDTSIIQTVDNVQIVSDEKVAIYKKNKTIGIVNYETVLCDDRHVFRCTRLLFVFVNMKSKFDA